MKDLSEEGSSRRIGDRRQRGPPSIVDLHACKRAFTEL